MENTTYVGLSKQRAVEVAMGITANNIANMNTPGYRAQNPVFAQYLFKTKGDLDTLIMPYDYGQYQNTLAGPVRQTGGKLDVALEGPGFIGVKGPNGETMYTRAGNFQRDAEGVLLTASGFPVMGDGGEITLPENSQQLSIAKDGTLSTPEGEIGKLMIVEFANPQDLSPVGNLLYKSSSAGEPSERTTVTQGALEGSNVDPIVEMTQMIKISRTFQQIQALMNKEDERQRSGIQKMMRMA